MRSTFRRRWLRRPSTRLRTRVGAQVFGALACFGLGVAAVHAYGGRGATELARAVPLSAPEAVIVVREGRRGLIDAGGHFVALAEYRRIVSTSPVADSLLLALVEPDRIRAISSHGAQNSAFAYRYAGFERIDGRAAPEAILALEPDLLLVHGRGGSDRIDRLREAGIAVFDLGSMLGLETLEPNLRAVGALVGRPERGATLARRLRARMQRVASGLPATHRPPGALYLAIYDGKLYGGTRGSSYHDILRYAGLEDLAAVDFEGWPRFDPEIVLRMDPEVIVTHESMGAAICAAPGLGGLRPCRGQGRFVELPSGLANLPSLDLLEATERVFETV